MAVFPRNFAKLSSARNPPVPSEEERDIGGKLLNRRRWWFETSRLVFVGSPATPVAENPPANLIWRWREETSGKAIIIAAIKQ